MSAHPTTRFAVLPGLSALVVAAGLALAPGTASAAMRPAGAARSGPSASAKMICEGEGRAGVEAQTPSRLLGKPKPRWANQTYTCTYRFQAGTLVMSVKELPDKSHTDAYFASLRRRLGQVETLTIGQGAFLTKNDSVVVRKDFKVLLVDATKFPKRFGSPPTVRSDYTVGAAALIMSCWTGK